MRAVRRFFARLISPVTRRRDERRLHEEVAAHLAQQTAANIRAGMSPGEARRQAVLKFGAIEAIKEEYREKQSLPFIESLIQDTRYASRALRKSPGFTAVTVVTLALGIGATTAIFAVVNGILIQPLPYPQADRLVGVWHSARIQGVNNKVNLSAPMYVTYLGHNQTFQEFGVWRSGTVSVTGRAEPEQVQTIWVTYGTLPAFAVQPALGRWFSQADDTPETPETAILTYGYWQRQFGSAIDVLGRTIIVDSRPREVIAVMPESFRFLDLDPELILPQRFDRRRLPPFGNLSYNGIARLRPNVSLSRANADVARMMGIWTDEYVPNPQVIKDAQFASALRPLKEGVVGDIGVVLWVLTGTVGIVLLIACANVANLLLVRASGRRQELALRTALGASWYRIARELMLGSLTLGVAGGVIGIGLAYAAIELLIVMEPSNLPRLTEISIDPIVLAFTLATSLLSGLTFGLIPVITYARPHVAIAMAGAPRTVSAGRGRHRFQNALVVGQVALALVLLAGSGLMIRTFHSLRRVEPGFTRPDTIQTVRISIPVERVAQPERVIRMQNDILDEIRNIPGVASAAFATALPMETEFIGRNNVSAEGRNVEGEISPIRPVKFISPELFKTQGTRLIAGRDFTWSDIYGTREVAIISESMARETWGTPTAALGQRIRVGSGAWREIVGVVEGVHDDGVHKEAPPTVYWRAGVQAAVPASPSGTVPRAVTFAIRSDRTASEGFIDDIQQAVWTIDPNIPLAQVRTLASVYDKSMARTSFTLVILTIAAAMALALGIIGIYGVISYVVSQRNRETGIRLTLGALPGELTRRFVRQAVALALIGVVIGFAAAIGLTRLMSTLLFAVHPVDPVTYVTAAFIMIAAAIFASYLPARRVALVDPIVALRYE